MSKTTAASLLAIALLWALPVNASAIGGSALQQQATGIVSGSVTDAAANSPLVGAQISIAGTGLGTLTDARGRFTIANVPAGEVTVVAQMLGFATIQRRATVQAGATVDLEFPLSQRALDLDAIVVTGTAGGTQRRAVGNVVSSVKADEVMAVSPVGTVNQLLGQRTPGVVMLPGTGQVGTGSAVRVRGVGSISQDNDPIIYIDGVRMNSDPRSGPAQRGGANMSRLNDIHPADIESIEIIKGPAAATLYGTEASNGVIQIITKRGASGAPQFDASVRLGTNWMVDPAGRASDLRWMPDPVTGAPVGFNVYENEITNGNGALYSNGMLQSYNLSLRGGSDFFRYFGSVSHDDDVGIVEWNWNKRTAMRLNLDAIISPKLTVTAGASYLTGKTRLSEGSLATSTFHGIFRANPRQLTDARRGWAQIPPEDMEKVESRSDNSRTTTSVELRYQPFSWLTNRLVGGFDVNDGSDWMLHPMFPQGASHFLGQLALGSKVMTRSRRSFATLDYSGSGNFNWRDLALQPSVGFQYYATQSDTINASGERFPAIPITTISGGSVRTSGEGFSENATVGVYVQQQVGWKNRAFVTAAVRADDNSAFGEEFDAAIYPKLSATWVVSEEPFWSLGFIEQLRLRGAYGAAGRQPGAFAAARLYQPAVGGGNQPALVPFAYGNPQLKPERGEEIEVGFDASFFNGRLDVEVTRYQKKIKDAIIERQLAPSSGFSGAIGATNAQIVNLGLIAAWGNELGVTARLVDGPRFGWEVNAQLANNANEIEDLGGQAVIFAGTQSQHRVGYSIGDIFMRSVLTATSNAAGVVTSSTCDGGTGPDGVDPGGAPVACASAPQVLVGHSQPTWQIGVGSSFTLFTNLTLFGRVEGNGGHYQVDTSVRAAHNATTTEATVRRDNAMLNAYRAFEADRTSLYKAGFLRLREVSATYNLPIGLAERVGARRGSIGVGMRNVAMLWTAQHGWSTPRSGAIREDISNVIIWDPEVRSVDQLSAGFQTVMPPTASATMTVRFSF